MTKDESLRLALEALKEDRVWLETDAPTVIWEKNNEAIIAISEALETKDEPVAWGMEKDGVILDVICPEEHEREEGEYTIPLYTTPQSETKDELICDKNPQGCWSVRCQLGNKCKNTTPQRTWVDLTEEDIQKLAAEQHDWESLCFAVQAKLKEKNNAT